MRTTVRRWGNSLGLRIPKAFAGQLGIEADTEVELSLEDDTLVVRPRSVPRYALEDLLREVTPHNVHGGVHTGDPTGREIW